MLRRTLVSACAGALLCLTAGAAGAAVSNFGTDVNTAIDRGLGFLTAQGSFAPYASSGSSCGGGDWYLMSDRGMALTALLEKRRSGNLDDQPQGYSNATEADKEKMRNAAACILDAVNENSFYSYQWGNWLMGLSLYARTGGPGKGSLGIPDVADLMALPDAIDKMTTDLLNTQCKQDNPTATQRGMWLYTECGNDSSTTQFAVAGLSGAKAYYKWKGDTAKVATIDTALANAAKHYSDWVQTGSSDSTCRVIEATESGHSYRTNWGQVSSQQSASGLWVQLIGGSSLNDPGVQRYLRWWRNHYRYQDINTLGDQWDDSYFYYLWSSIKAYMTVKESGASPNVGNLGIADIGKLGPNVDPNPLDSLAGTCPVRQVHKDPATVSQPTSFGTNGPGHYAGEQQSVYFDYAHTLLTYQCANGNFACGGAPGNHGGETTRAEWALLVLQRSTGGACVDLNQNGKCDSDEGDEEAGGLLCDSNGDDSVTYGDLRDLYGILASTYPVGVPVTAQTEWANYNSSGASASTIDINDFWQCYWVSTGKLVKKYIGD